MRAAAKPSILRDDLNAWRANRAGAVDPNALRTTGQKVRGALAQAPGVAKSIVASLDVSYLLRQGLRPLITHPRTWARNAKKSFADIVDTFGGKEVLDALDAEIKSRPNAPLYRTAGLAVGESEEAFPSSLPSRIPVVGKAFKASEAAFTAFQYRNRADIFDQYLELARGAGVNVSDETQLKSIGKLVNSLTGRAHLGSLEPTATVVNNVFFSPRALKAHFDVLTAHAADSEMSGFAKVEAAKNLAKVVTAMAGVMAVANAVKPGSAETDPRSANFGQIRVGDTRFDFSGGMRSLVTLASRLLTMSSKSATTGKSS